MKLAPVAICVVGAPGLIGLRHTRHCLDEPEVELSCIVDPTPAGVELSKRHNLPLFTSITDMLTARAKGEVRVVGAILATPNATHVPLAKQLVEAGVHTLVEKPLCTDIESGAELIKLSEAKKTQVLCGHHRRFNPYIVNLKRLIDSGKLGEILAVQGLWTVLKPPSYYEGATSWRAEPGTGGVMMINLVHDLDLLLFLLGPISNVTCHLSPLSTRSHAVDETGVCTLTFASGVLGTFIFSDAVTSPYNFESATGENPLFPRTGQEVYKVLGTKGSGSFPELRVWKYSNEDGCWTDELVQEEAEHVEDVPPFTTQLKHFVAVCRGEQEPICSGSEALRTMRTLDALRESANAGGIPVKVQSGC